LVLDLDCNPQSQQRPGELDPSHRELLMNAATDVALATAIWNMITYQQASHTLQNLRCTPFVQPVTNKLLRLTIGHLSRSLLVTRPNSPLSGAIEITEIGANERIACLKQLQAGEHNSDWKSLDSLYRIENLVRELWPGETLWSGRWRSFPLQVSAYYCSARTVFYLC
jgi:hypothetical protein